MLKNVTNMKLFLCVIIIKELCKNYKLNLSASGEVKQNSTENKIMRLMRESIFTSAVKCETARLQMDRVLKKGTMQNHQNKLQSENHQIPLINERPVVRYSDDELNEFKELVTEKLNRSREEYQLLKEILSHKSDNGISDTLPAFNVIEDASDALAKEEMSGQAMRLLKYMEHLQNALVRIQNKTYGICSVTGSLISKERLRSVPHATMCVDAKLGIRK